MLVVTLSLATTSSFVVLRDKMKLLLIVSACLAHLLLTETSAVPAQDCGEIFQSLLRRLEATQPSCDSAGFYDCCQVRILSIKCSVTTQLLFSHLQLGTL